MNVLILAAGYATRLYPLTLNKAKPLLEVAGKPMIEWVLDNLAPIPDLGTVYIVTNNKFAADFQAWADGYNQRQPKIRFQIVNDGSTSDQDKLGAIGDIHLVVNQEKLDRDGLLVVAGDNLFSQSLEEFAAFAKGTAATLATYDVGDLEAIKKYNNLTLDEEGRIVAFEEKPQHPDGHDHGHRAVLFRAGDGQACSTPTSRRATIPTSRGGSSSGCTRAWPVHTYPVSGHLVRHRQQGDAGGSERDVREVPVGRAIPGQPQRKQGGFRHAPARQTVEGGSREHFLCVPFWNAGSTARGFGLLRSAVLAIRIGGPARNGSK